MTCQSWNLAIVNIISSACGFPALTNQKKSCGAFTSGVVIRLAPQMAKRFSNDSGRNLNLQEFCFEQDVHGEQSMNYD